MKSAVRTEPPWTSIFARRGWLAQAPEDLRRSVLAEGRSLCLKRGARVFSSADPPGGIYGVLTGGIGIEGSSPWHPIRVGHVLREGHWFGYLPALVGGDRTMGFLATEATELVHIPLPALNRLKRSEPSFAMLLSQMAVIGETLATLIIGDLLLKDSRRRVAAVLLRVTGAHESVAPSDPRGFALSQSQLGEMANTSRNYTNQTLRFFAEKGWISLNYTRIYLTDIKALANFAYLDD